MDKKRNSLKTNGFMIVLLMLISVIIGRAFLIAPLQISLVWPAFGFGFALILYYGFKVIPHLSIGFLLGYLLSYIITGDVSIITMTLTPLLLTGIALIALITGFELSKWLSYNFTLELPEITKLLIIGLLISVLSSLLTNVFFFSVSLHSETPFIETFMVGVMGNYFSFFIFGAPLLFALYYDPHALPIKFKKYELLFYSIFLVFTFLFFIQRIPGINFETHKFIFSVFAFMIAFKFPYRTAYTFSLIVCVALLFFQPFPGAVTQSNLLLDVNLFLTILTLIVIVIKRYLTRIELNNAVILEKSSRLDRLINATYSLLSFSSEFHALDKSRFDLQIKKMFRTIFTLFDKADYATCMTLNKSVTFVDGIGYDLDSLNQLKISREQFDRNLKDPRLVHQAEAKLRKKLKDKYAFYTKHNPLIKQSLHFGLILSPNLSCEMSFDLDIESKEHFTEFDLAYFRSIQKLLNSFYEAEQISIEFDVIKNDIVLSLLRTLELFDENAGQHSLDVAIIAQAIGTKMELKAATISELYWSGIVHDIGKLGIDEGLILKKGVLSVADYDAMKKHSILGYQILQESESLKEIALDIKYIHEHFDGSGYPDGVKGDAIPLNSQILHVSEAIATMMRNQSYQEGLTKDEIINELERQKNKQFSPACVEIAIQLINANLLEHVQRKYVS